LKNYFIVLAFPRGKLKVRFLTITSIKRQDDLIYLINNSTLGLLTIVSFLAGVLSWLKIQNGKFNLSLTYWLNSLIE